METFVDAKRIYSPKSREYFKEVISSYENGNYRSAIVMLYSICLCDLVFKLQELRDLYGDGTARKILEDIDKEKENSASKSSWEKEIGDKCHESTNLLDDENYINLNNLFSKRNLCAHPALNNDTELYMPIREEVAAFIRLALDGILLKPAVFAKNIVSLMSEDLDEKKGYILNDINAFQRYVSERYLDRMSDAMYIKTFTVFWRLSMKETSQKCQDNRLVNFYLLHLMICKRESVIMEAIQKEADKFEVRDDIQIVHHAIRIFAFHPKLYNVMADHTKALVISKVTNKHEYLFLSWFLYDKPQRFIDSIMNYSLGYGTPESETIDWLENYLTDNGYRYSFLNIIVHITCHSTSFVQAMHMLSICRKYLSFFNKEQFCSIFKSLDENSQLYGCYDFNSFCSAVWKNAQKYFSVDSEEIKENQHFGDLVRMWEKQ